MRTMYINPNRRHRLRAAMIDTKPVEAEIRRTDDGARIRFSDGRIVWLDKDPHVSETGFMAAIMQWVRRHGAKSVTIETD